MVISEITVASVSTEWLGMKRLTVKQSTFSHYYSIVQKHIIPDLGNVPLTQITSSVINTFTCRKLGLGDITVQGETGACAKTALAAKTVRDICTVLKSILKYGENEYQIGCLAGNSVLPKKKREERKALSKQELKKIESYLWKNQSDARCVGLLVCIYTGMRLGEICALKWSDIDMKQKLLCVNRTMQRIRIPENHGSPKTRIIMDDPKTFSSFRTIPISRKLYPAVQSLYDKKRKDSYFLTSSEQYVEPRSYQYFFKRILKRNDIRDVNFHILRHTFASRCVEAGMDVKTLSEILGHSNTNITLGYYVHSTLESKRKQINMLKI